MILYSTLLDINMALTKDAFIQLVIEWNQGSPYEENIIRGISWNGERNVRFGDDKLWLEIIEYRNKNIIAIRYEKIADDGAIWDTDYIMNFDEMRMAIRLDRSYLEEAIVTNAEFTTPHFITMLVERGYLKSDGDLEVIKDALEITENNVSLLADVVLGKVKYQLPIVYVSKTFENTDPIAVNWLCSRLKGAAHVLVQKDIHTNNTIRTACNDLNDYNGTIGVYYPNDSSGHKRCTYRKGFEKKTLDRVVGYVLQFGILQRIDKLYTWQGVSNSLLSDRYTSQKLERQEAETTLKKTLSDLIQAENAKNEAEKDRAKAEKLAEDIYDIVDEDIKKYKRTIDDLSKQNAILTNDIYGLRAKLASIDEKPILVQGDEEDIYAGEIKDIVLSVINEEMGRVHEESRRADVLRDILNSNSYEGLSGGKREEIKRLFKGYSGMTGALKNSLHDLGFDITKDGKHYKLTYGADSRYVITIPCTPRDTARAGDNAASIINKKVF